MKKDILERLEAFKKALTSLKSEVSTVQSERVSRSSTRNVADSIATQWVEELRSPLEHKFKIPQDTIKSTSEQMKRLHILSRPNNLKTSYIKTINAVLKKFEDKFTLPIKQSSYEIASILDLQKLIPGLADPAESEYLKEAINCAGDGYPRAAVVMGWCAVIDKIQKEILSIGLEKFNETSTNIKNQKRGRFRRWNKEFSVATLSELQEVFDTDLIVILEGMDLIDGNQAERLRTCFQYRKHSAHPGKAPIDDPHLVVFFTDINDIVLQNPTFSS